MRTMLTLVMALALPCVAAAQSAKDATADAQRANKHYAQGWTAIRAESWDDAVREFEGAIDADPKFALAYYSLGRAQMGLHDFTKAIAAYTKCKDLYTTGGGQQYSSQMNTRQRLNDQIFEYQTALEQAQTRAANGKTSNQTQSLYVRELQTQINRLELARDRNVNVSIDTEVPYYVSMALGAAYFRSGQVEDAEREYKAAIAANGSSGETHNNLAVLYLMTGRFDDADTEVKAAEKSGFRVNENLKGDIKRRRTGG
jgi:Flp pilus assembly protein TadD